MSVKDDDVGAFYEHRQSKSAHRRHATAINVPNDVLHLLSSAKHSAASESGYATGSIVTGRMQHSTTRIAAEEYSDLKHLCISSHSYPRDCVIAAVISFVICLHKRTVTVSFGFLGYADATMNTLHDMLV